MSEVKKKILTVDDEPEILEVYRDLFPVSEYTLFQALNGREAMQILLDEKINLVITDLKMPKLNGLDFVKLAREKGFVTPFILVTGHGDLDTRRDAWRHGVQQIEKPFKFDDLLHEAQVALGLEESFLKTEALNFLKKFHYQKVEFEVDQDTYIELVEYCENNFLSVTSEVNKALKKHLESLKV